MFPIGSVKILGAVSGVIQSYLVAQFVDEPTKKSSRDVFVRHLPKSEYNHSICDDGLTMKVKGSSQAVQTRLVQFKSIIHR